MTSSHNLGIPEDRVKSSKIFRDFGFVVFLLQVLRFFLLILDVHLPCVAARPISALGCGQSKTARGQVSWHRFTLVHIGWHVRDTEESLVGDGGRWRKPHRNDLTAPSPRALTEFPECFVACLPEHKAPRAPGHPLPSWHVLKRLDVTDVS